MSIHEFQPMRYRSARTVLRARIVPAIRGAAARTARARLRALLEALCRLPPNAYEVLEKTRITMEWTSSDGVALGRARRSPDSADETGGKGQASYVVELSERLEGEPREVVLTVVVHELAHVVLRHKTIDDPIENGGQEVGAWSFLHQWGFAAEANAAAVFLQRDTYPAM